MSGVFGGIEELSKQIAAADGSVFVDYRGLTHSKLEELRTAVEKDNASLSVTKNTLLQIALKNNNAQHEDQFESDLSGPTATIFLQGDIISPLKKLAEFIKKNELPVIKSGYIENTYTSADQIEMLASLSSREDLIARLMGQLNAPITNVALTIKAPLQYLVFALTAISTKKQQGGEA